MEQRTKRYRASVSHYTLFKEMELPNVFNNYMMIMMILIMNI